MFRQLKKINNESGIILFIVLMTAIIIMILSLGILTQSMNESNFAQQQIDQITAQEASKGIFWNAYSNGYFNGTATVNGSFNAAENSRTYQMSINTTAETASENQYNVTTNYDTFQ